jgi:hypothetical protein
MHNSLIAAAPVPPADLAAAVEALATREGWQDWLVMRRFFRTRSAAQQFLAAWTNPGATVDAADRVGIHQHNGDGLGPAIKPLATLGEHSGWTVRFTPLPDGAPFDIYRGSSVLVINPLMQRNRVAMALVAGLSIILIEDDPVEPELSLTADEADIAADSCAWTVAVSLGVDQVYNEPPAPQWRAGRTTTSVARLAALVDRTAKQIEAAVLEGPTNV